MQDTIKDFEFAFTPGEFKVTDEVKKSFDQNGAIMLRNLLDGEELNKLKTALEHDEGVLQKAYDIYDSDNPDKRATRLCLWNMPGNDITGMLARCNKVAGTMTDLLGGEVYHYHTKLMMKEAKEGGKFVWHQDYGYWYDNGCLFPDMGTVFIAVDKCVAGNGCLRVVPGSHKCGRIEHNKVGGMIQANTDRVNTISEQLGVISVDMEPGDALFFHSNVLHTSERNNSDMRRWAFLIAYNRKSNNPVIKHHHPRYTPLERVSDEAIKECTTNTDMTGKAFMLQRDKDSYGRGNLVVEDDHLL